MQRAFSLAAAGLVALAAFSAATDPAHSRDRRPGGEIQLQGKRGLQNPKAFNPQPGLPSRKGLGGPDTKSLGGPDTKSRMPRKP